MISKRGGVLAGVTCGAETTPAQWRKAVQGE